MDVFTYYDASPTAPSDQPETFRTWETSWAKLGWNTRILTSRRARQSPLYASVAARLANPEIALPWLALHAAGGGWLVPQKTINKTFKPAGRREKILFYYPGVLWATRRGVEEILKTAWTKEWDDFFIRHFKTTLRAEDQLHAD